MRETSQRNTKLLRVLHVGMRYDYGDPKRGDCHEYANFYQTLARMEGVETAHFPFDVVLREEGQSKMNKKLLETAREFRPDVGFFALFTDEITKETIQQISGTTLTLGWFGDDHWRFEGYSRFWAPLFRYVVTTDTRAVEKYRAIGVNGVIKSQWGFNHYGLAPQQHKQDLEVSFVGQVHSNRRRIVKELSNRGIHVYCRGKGWKEGTVSHSEMVSIFQRSKINLNLTQSSFGVRPRSFAKAFLSRRADGSIHLNNPIVVLHSLKSIRSSGRTQIKGRNFEIPGNGGFLLTQDADDLHTYYTSGEEVVIFDNIADLEEKIRFYLLHDIEREAIRKAGNRRTLRDHTYQKRFEDMFRVLGLFE